MGFFLNLFWINWNDWMPIHVHYSTHLAEKDPVKVIVTYLPSVNSVCRRIPLVHHVICLDVCFTPSLPWWPGHALTMAEGWQTPRHTNVCGGMCLMFWRVFCRELAGWEVSRYFNYTQLTTSVCLQGHPWPSSDLIRLLLQRKYEYELLFA